MFSGGRERVHWEKMGQGNHANKVFNKNNGALWFYIIKNNEERKTEFTRYFHEKRVTKIQLYLLI